MVLSFMKNKLFLWKFQFYKDGLLTDQVVFAAQ